MDPFYLLPEQIVRLLPAPGKFLLRLSFMAVLLGPTLLAQPVLVKDINRTSPPGVGARELINVNGQIFFMANDGLTGFELWKSDGTAGGTQLVKDISPVDTYPGNFTNVNGTLFFTAKDANSGNSDWSYDLWKSDGTAGGTVKVKDIPMGDNTFAMNLTNVNGTLYYVLANTDNPVLWKSNGTEAGTVLVKEWIGGSANTLKNLTDVNGILYFSIDDGTSGQELWKSDGTAAGTVRIKDLNPGPGSGIDLFYGTSIRVNGTLYFSATDGTSGYELWKTDGTAAGTVRVKDINPGAASASPYEFTNVNGILYFAADDGATGQELWKSDGTTAGTVRVKDILPGGSGSLAGSIPHFTNVGGTLMFMANYGNELWKSDGTAAGTVKVKSIRPLLDFQAPDLVSVNGTLYFPARDSGNGVELWKSDGTALGTVLVKDIAPGTKSAYPGWLTNLNGTLLFIADFEPLEGVTSELWKSNGTAAGTQVVKVINAQTPSASPSQLVNVNNTLYFTADDGAGFTSWKSDGTELGTTKTPLAPEQLTLINSTFYFTSKNGLYKSDGTSPGTTLLKQFKAVGSDSNPYSLINLKGVLYFIAQDGTSGFELWKSNGTAAGTVRVKDINAGAASAFIDASGNVAYAQLFNHNGMLYFRANDGQRGTELWKSDGTATGTVMVKDISPGESGSFPNELVFANGTVYFTAHDGTSGFELWKSDGTSAGTVMVKDIYPGESGSFLNELVFANGTLYFSAYDGTSGFELWKSNGTAGGTVMVKDLFAGPGSAEPTRLTNVNGTLFFNANDGTTGQELWKSDGTGTVLVKDIVEGSGDSYLSNFTNVNGTLLFIVRDVAGSRQLWKSDGTAAGTALVRDMHPGIDGFGATDLVNVNGVLYFTADDGLTGVELWKYDPKNCMTPTASLTVQGSTVCLNNPARVTVKATQAGVSYQLHYPDISDYYNSALAPPVKSAGGELVLTVPAAYLSAGTNRFLVKAMGCTEVMLTQTATVTVLTSLTAPTAANRTINSGQTATLTASGAPPGATYRWYSAAGGGTPLFTGANYTTPVLMTTTSYYVASALVACAESARTKVTVTVSPAGGAPAFRVNAGGNAFATIDARSFTADTYFSGGVVSSTVTQAIMGTADDYLYQTGRHGSSFSYNFPTGNGSYDVVLHFAETYFGVAAPGGAGSRKFHVNMEGGRKLTDYDIVARAGGALKVAQETFRINVSDGTLTIAFLKGAADHPTVKAIEVLPAGSALTLNSGGGAVTTTAGKRFYPDSYYASGSVSSISGGDILNTSDDELYHNARVGVFSYGLPSGNGTFDVVLHFAETYWGSRASGGIGSRKFNLHVENVKRLSEYDIFAKAGGAMRAIQETIRVTVSDGVLNLYFAKGTADNPAVSAIEVIPVTVAARVSAEPTDAEEWHANLFPNPVADRLTIHLPFLAHQVNATAVTDVAGHALLTNAHRVSSENQVYIEVGKLPKGLYLLKIDTQHGYRVLKFIKQ